MDLPKETSLERLRRALLMIEELQQMFLSVNWIQKFWIKQYLGEISDALEVHLREREEWLAYPECHLRSMRVADDISPEGLLNYAYEQKKESVPGQFTTQ